MSQLKIEVSTQKIAMDEVVDDKGSTEVPFPDDVIFPDCPLKKNISTILIMSYIIRHKLSLKAAQYLIELLVCHFPEGHTALTSLFKLKSYWKKRCLQPKHVKDRICTNCDGLLQANETKCQRPECCDMSMLYNEFLALDIETAIGQLFHGMMRLCLVLRLCFCYIEFLYILTSVLNSYICLRSTENHK